MVEIKQQLESILFISPKPVKIKQLAKILDVSVKEIEANLKLLADEYQTTNRGIQISENSGKAQMITAAENSELVEKFIKDDINSELTRPALETLTIVAYRGPVSKIDLEMIRGVNCSLILRNLMIRGLVEEREDKEKHQMIYQVTFDFLKYLGIRKVQELPDYDRLNRDIDLTGIMNKKSVAPADESPVK